MSRRSHGSGEAGPPANPIATDASRATVAGIDLGPAIDRLEPGSPLVLNDGMLITDGGHLVMTHYVDVGLTKSTQRPLAVVKAIESRFGLEHAATMRLSAPPRFRDYGETLIHDDQEGRAARQQMTREEPRDTSDIAREQERALDALGVNNVTINHSEDGAVHTQSEALSFGSSSWIYCTSVLPLPDQRDSWRRSLPATYDHESVIRQPIKLAQALGAMFADQVGPHAKGGRFTHNNSIESLHESQIVMHGPVWYTDGVYGFLKQFESHRLYSMFRLFVKDRAYQAQQEYRFVLHCETSVEAHTLDLRFSGMLRDSLAPPIRSSAVDFQTDGEESGRLTVSEDKPGLLTTRKTKQSSNRKRWTREINGVVAEKGATVTEQLVELTIAAPDGPVTSNTVRIEEQNTTEREIEGFSAESETSTRTRIYRIDDVNALDEFFTLGERNQTEELLAAAARPFTDFTALPTEVSAALTKLAQQAPSLHAQNDVKAMSACWNTIWAICNLYEAFGDIVKSVEIEHDEYVAIELKPPPGTSAEGKLLVGPHGTYAYLLSSEGKRTPGHGGDETRMFVFPDEQTRLDFEAAGWVPDAEDLEIPST